MHNSADSFEYSMAAAGGNICGFGNLLIFSYSEKTVFSGGLEEVGTEVIKGKK